MNPDVIVAGGRDSGVFLSTDGGKNWRLLTDPFEGTLKDAGNHQIPDLPRPRFAFFKHANDDPNQPLSLYIGTQGRGVWKIDVNFDLQQDSDDMAAANNTLATATALDKVLSQTRSDRTIHNNTDIDYYKFTAQETGRLLVTLSSNSLRGLLNVDVRDDQDAVIANTLAATDENRTADQVDQQRIVVNVEKGTDYFVRVASAKNPLPPNASLGHTNFYNLEVQNLAALNVEVKGGEGLNTLRAADRLNAWTLNAADGGTLNDTTAADVTFEKVGNVVGGADIDKFTFSTNTGALSGGIDGGGPAGLNKVTFFNSTKARVTSRNAGTGTGIVAGFVNVAELKGSAGADQFDLTGGVLRGSGLIDGGDGDDTLTGDDITSSWLIVGPDSGQVTGLNDGFAGFEHLIGGFANDDFVITGGITFGGSIDGGAGDEDFVLVGDVAGLIDGGDNTADGNDVLDLSQRSGPLVIDVKQHRFVGVETIIGNVADSTLIGEDTRNVWNVTGQNDGTLNGLNFENFNHITGRRRHRHLQLHGTRRGRAHHRR